MTQGTGERSFARPTGASALALMVVAMPAFLLGAFGPSIKEDLDFGDTALGAIFTLGYFMSAIGMLIGGRFADTSGPRKVMRAGIATSAIASLMFGTDRHLADVVGDRPGDQPDR